MESAEHQDLASAKGFRSLTPAMLLALPALAYGTYFILTLNIYRFVSTIPPDDSFYYLSVARNFWRYHAFTYDGINPCYGFQPLWQLLLIAVAAIPSGTGTFLKTALLLSHALFVTTGILLYAFVRPRLGTVAAVLSMAAWTFNTSHFYYDGPLSFKENAIVPPVLLCCLLLLPRGLLRDGKPFLLGVTLGLLFLARFNAIFFVGMVLAFLVVRILARSRRDIGEWRALGAVALSALLVSGAWYSYARIALGSIMPYTGHVKTAESRRYLDQLAGEGSLSRAHFAAGILVERYRDLWCRWYPSFHQIPLYPLALLGLPMIVPLIRLNPWRAPPLRQFLGCFALLLVYSLLNTFINCYHLRPGFVEYARWYFTGESIVVPLFIAFLGWLVVGPPRSSTIATLQVLLALSGANVAYALSRGGGSAHSYLAAAPLLIIMAGVIMGRHVSGTFLTRSSVALLGLFTPFALIWAPPQHWSYERAFVSLPRNDPLNISTPLPPARVSEPVQFYVVGLHLRHHLPPDSVIAASDTGIFSYFSEQKVMNMEGLMNSLEYFAMLQRTPSKIPDYLTARGTRYLFGPCDAGTQLLPDGNWVYYFLYHGGNRPEHEMAWWPFPGELEFTAPFSVVRGMRNAPPEAFVAFGQPYRDGKPVLIPRFLTAHGEPTHESRPGSITLDFETLCYDGWSAQGPAMGSAPAAGHQTEYIVGMQGRAFVDSSAAGGDGLIGRLVSSPFRLDNTLVSVRVAGGRDPLRLAFRVISEGEVLASVTGNDDNEPLLQILDLTEHHGRTAHMEILDAATGPMGHLIVDDIQFIRNMP